MATKRPRFDDFASRLPLLTAGNSLLQTANPPCCLLPLEAWHEKLQQFVDVIPDSGRLASIYWLAAGGAASESLKPALVAWNICCSDFLTVGPHTPEGELIEKVLWQDDQKVAGPRIKYTVERWSRIPLLGEIIGKIGTDEDKARRFLLFLLTVVIHHPDSLWQDRSVATPVSHDSGALAP